MTRLSDKGRRQGCMRDCARLRLGEKSRCSRHANDAAQLMLWNACQVGYILCRDAAVEWNAGKYLEFPKPLDTGEQLILRIVLC